MPTSRHRKKQKQRSQARKERIKSEAGQIKNLMLQFQKNLDEIRNQPTVIKTSSTLLTGGPTQLPE